MDVIIGTYLAHLIQQGATEIGDLLVWTVYRHPSDYRRQYIARPFSTRRLNGVNHLGDPNGKAVILVGDTLQEVRNQLPPGLFLLPRKSADDPPIVECWV